MTVLHLTSLMCYLACCGRSTLNPPLQLTLAPANRPSGETAQPDWRREVPALDTPPDRRPRQPRNLHYLRNPQYSVHLNLHSEHLSNLVALANMRRDATETPSWSVSSVRRELPTIAGRFSLSVSVCDRGSSPAPKQRCGGRTALRISAWKSPV